MTHQIAAYLITTAVGYWVLTLAEKEKGNNKKAGKVIGWAIIVISLCGCLCMTCGSLMCHSRYGQCSTSLSCPYSGMPQGGPPPMGVPDKSK